MNLAAAAGGTAANVAINQLANWWNRPAQTYSSGPYNMGQMAQALPPSNAQARGGRGRGRGGRGQRGRRRGRGSGGVNQGVSTRGGAKILVRDTEVISAIPDGLSTYVFNPAPELPRLKRYEEMYGRYRIKYMNIAFKAGVGTATTGNVGMGILVGPKNVTVTKDKISALRPYVFTPGWKSATMSIGADIDTARWMICGDDTIDGVAFTLYVAAAGASLGVLQISYEVEFDQPKPF